MMYCDECGAELIYGDGFRHIKTGECRCLSCVPWTGYDFEPGWKLIPEEELLEEEKEAADAATPTTEVQKNQQSCA